MRACAPTTKQKQTQHRPEARGRDKKRGKQCICSGTPVVFGGKASKREDIDTASMSNHPRQNHPHNIKSKQGRNTRTRRASRRKQTDKSTTTRKWNKVRRNSAPREEQKQQLPQDKCNEGETVAAARCPGQGSHPQGNRKISVWNKKETNQKKKKKPLLSSAPGVRLRSPSHWRKPWGL